MQMVEAISAGKKSSSIARFGWANNVLAVEFVSGKMYAYTGVPQSEHLNMLSASSKGEYFSEHIRNSFPFKMVSSLSELADLAKLGTAIGGMAEQIAKAFSWMSIPQGDTFF